MAMAYEDYFSTEKERADFAEFVIDDVGINYGTPQGLSPCEYLTRARMSNCVTQILELHSSLANYNSMYSQIENLIHLDDKDQFAVFLTNYHHQLLNFGLQELFSLLVHHSALGCLTALLQSPLQSHVDVNHCNPHPPLITPAIKLSFPMVSFLLHHGADPDVSIIDGTPLSLALRTFCSRLHHWNPAKPLVELFHLIFSPQMKVSLDTIKVLASQSKQVQNLCFKYVADGNIIRFAILLTAASHKLLARLEEGLENTPVVQYILGELKCEANQLCGVSSSKGKNLVDAFNVVKTFCLNSGFLERYGQIVLEDFSGLVRGGLFVGEPAGRDNIESLLSKLTLEAEGIMNLMLQFEEKEFVDDDISCHRVPSQKHYGSISGGFTGERRMGIAGYSSFPSNFWYRAFYTREGAHFDHLKLVDPRSKFTLVKPSLVKKFAPIMWLAKRSLK